MERSPIRRLGGKHQQATAIVGLLPPHRIYVEPFAGAAAVFFRKGKIETAGYREVLNDLDDGIFSFFRALRDHPTDLAERLAAVPYSRREAREAVIAPDDDVMTRAVKTVVALYQTFGAQGNPRGKPSGWGFGREGNDDRPGRWRRLPDIVLAAADRLKDAYIDSLDFERCIRLWDTEETVFFADPPYVGCEDFYAATFTGEDHERLARVLRSIRGRALVTYYDHPLVRKLFRGWRVIERRVVSRAAKRRLGESCSAKIELCLMNYAANGTRLERSR